MYRYRWMKKFRKQTEGSGQEWKNHVAIVIKQNREQKVMNRLNRIEGQIRGIKGMLEKNAYCTDILVQVAAVNSALNSFNKELLAEHIRTCVIEDIKAGKEDTVDDLVDTIKKLMK